MFELIKLRINEEIYFSYWFGTDSSVALQKFGHSFQCSLAAVIDDRVRVLGEQLDGWEALNFDVFQLVEGRVHFGDHKLAAVLEVLGQLIVNRRQLLAVSTPWSIFNAKIFISRFYK